MEIDIEKKIIKDFGKDAKEALRVIGEFEKQAKLSPRVSRCIVVLSKGSLKELFKVLEEAKKDWRNVIEYAESWTFEYNSPFQ